jgi:hypothetical protein
MNPIARVAIPESTPTDLVDAIKRHLGNSYPHITIEYELKADIDQPIALSFDRNGAGLGGIDGNMDTPSIAIISGIHIEANRAFRRV